MSSSPEPRGNGIASKRKRDIIPENEDEKLEIDVNLPEPPSKKAKRKEKKQIKKPAPPVTDEDDAPASKEEAKPDPSSEVAIASTASAPVRSQYGIWVGNLPFSVTKDSLRQFLQDTGGIDDASITRVHLPTGQKGQNKGFAYVDVTTPAVLEIALALSEKMIGGRRVLIKDAKSFEGRPEKATGTDKEGNTGGSVDNKKEPSKRIFVGNLGFDVTRDELADHFSPAGTVEDVFLATFEDSGKCKGFGWVRFATIDAAESAVKGFVYQEPEADDDGGEQEAEAVGAEAPKSKTSKKRRKFFINRIHGRSLRCEFAEDAQTRYKKRYGHKQTSSKNASSIGARDDNVVEESTNGNTFTQNERPKMRKPDKEDRREERRRRHDARTIAPGKALAGAPRATGAIVAGAGRKVTFD